MVHMLEIVRQVGKVDFPQVIVSNFSDIASTFKTHFPSPFMYMLQQREERFLFIQTRVTRSINYGKILIKAPSHSNSIAFTSVIFNRPKNPRLLLILFISISLHFKLLSLFLAFAATF